MTELAADQRSSVDSPFPIGCINRLLVRIASFVLGKENVGGDADVVGWFWWLFGKDQLT